MVTFLVLFAAFLALLRWGGRWLNKHFGDMV